MRKRGARRWLWTLWVASAVLPISAHSKSALVESSAVNLAMTEVQKRGEASLHQAASTAVLAVVAAEAAQDVVHRVTHPGDAKEALSDCQTRWGSELGPVLCPAMFAEDNGRHRPENVEVRLLGAMWHIVGHHAGLWWEQGHAAAVALLGQVRALTVGDDAP